MQTRWRGLLALTGALVMGLAVLPATAEPPAHAIPQGPGLTSVPFPSGSPSSSNRALQRAPAAPPTTDEVTPVDPHGGFVDGCDDAVSAPDVRRLFVVVDPSGDAEFSLMLCDGADAKAALTTGSYAWVTRAGDEGQNYRRIDVEPDGGDGLTITISRGVVDLEGNVSYVPLAGSHNVRWRMDTAGPAPRLVVLFAASALGISGTCDPDDATPCLAMTFAALDGGGAPIDTVPDGPTGPPDISDRHSLFWPSPCGVTTGQGSNIGDSRAVLQVTSGREGRVAVTLRRAGYPATARSSGVVTIEAGASDVALIAFEDLPGVEQVHRHATRQLTVTPQDPYYDSGDGQWYLPRIGAPAGWDTTTGSTATRLGVVDDGIDGTREDFTGRVAGGYDAVNDAALPAGSNSDLGWHGTAVAAVAAATGSTSASATGMAGVDWKAQVVPIRVWGHNRCFDEVSYLQGLKWAADHGSLDVLNLSLGGPDPIEAIGDLPGERTTLRRLVREGTIVVAAAGNNAWIDSPTSYPAALPDVIAVGATARPADGQPDQLAPYSNQGRYIDVVAPGGAGTKPVGILTATDPTVHGSDFAWENGTSFSAPMVAGAAALYRAVQPDSTPADFTRALLATVEDLGPGMAGFDASFGFGMLDLAGLVTTGPSQTSRAIRTAGRDRYATAAVASQFAYRSPAQVRTVFLATGANFPDALAGAPFAAQRHGPILLTMKDGLPQPTIEELARLSPDDVVLFGGPGTISPTVESQLAAVLGYQPTGSCSVAFGDDRRSSCRLSGSNRYETAAVIAAQGWAQADVVYVATGGNYPDALAGGATAAAFDAPLLLTTPTELPASTRGQLERLQPRLVIVLGGQASVSDGVRDAIASIASVQAVVRASGPNRYRTAIAALCPDLLVCISDTRYVTIATGAGFADALAGSAIAAALRAPLLLADPAQPDADALAGALQYLEPERAVILGGEKTLPPAVETAISGYVVR